MKKYRVASQILALLCFILPSFASAFWDPPYVTPTDAVAGDTVFVNIRGGICDAIYDMEGYPQISEQGNAIRMVFAGDHYTDSELCALPVGGAPFPFGAYPAGDYTLQVDVDYMDGFGEPATLLMGTTSFGVRDVTPPELPAVPTPTLGHLGFLMLALNLIALTRRFILAESCETPVRACALFLHSPHALDRYAEQPRSKG